MGASAKQEVAGKALHGAGGGALHSGGENRAGRWEKEIRVVLQFLKIPGTTL